MATIESGRFRTVLGHFPTGVVAVTGIGPAGEPVGMAVGSFTSVSLEPALVAFLPAKSSTTFPRFRTSGSFCVNVLASDQEVVSRTLSKQGEDKFTEIGWKPAGSGAPIINGALAWIDCEIDAIHEAGDHFIVVGRVLDLEVETSGVPLVFFRGKYRRIDIDLQAIA